MFRSTVFYTLAIFVFSCGATDEGCTDSGTDTSSLLQVKASIHSAERSDARDVDAEIKDVHQEHPWWPEDKPYDVVFTCDFNNTDTGKLAKADGYAPEWDGSKFPLAVFTQGTHMPYKHGGADAFLKQMVDRNFVAVVVQYANMQYPGGECSVFQNKAKNVAGCIQKICDTYDRVDCSKGVATYGYSQGGQVANLAGNYNDNITATLAISSSILSHGGLTEGQKQCLVLDTPKSKRRIFIGEKDGHFGGNGSVNSGSQAGVIANALHMSGYNGTCTETTLDCIQPDGSGYYVATTADTGIADMNHFWFLGLNIFSPDLIGLNPVFEYADESKPWGAAANFDWLAHAATTP